MPHNIPLFATSLRALFLVFLVSSKLGPHLLFSILASKIVELNTLTSFKRRRLPLYTRPPTISYRHPLLHRQRHRSLPAQRTFSKQARSFALPSPDTRHHSLLGLRRLRFRATLPTTRPSVLVYGASLIYAISFPGAPNEMSNSGLGRQCVCVIYAFTARCAGLGGARPRRGRWGDEAIERVAVGKRWQARRDRNTMAHIEDV